MSRPVRVMIVEDSLVVHQLLSHIVGRDPRFVVAAASEWYTLAVAAER